MGRRLLSFRIAYVGKEPWSTSTPSANLAWSRPSHHLPYSSLCFWITKIAHPLLRSPGSFQIFSVSAHICFSHYLGTEDLYRRFICIIKAWPCLLSVLPFLSSTPFIWLPVLCYEHQSKRCPQCL